MAKEKTVFRVENEKSICTSIRSIAYSDTFHQPTDPVLLPFLITIYEAPNAQRGVPSVTPKIIIDYYPLAFGGTQEMDSSSRMDRREA